MSVKERLSTTGRRYITADVGEPAGKVTFRSITAGERIAIEQEALKHKSMQAASILTLMASVCEDDTEHLVYSIKFLRHENEYELVYDEDEYKALAEMDGRTFDALLDVINGFCNNSTPFDTMVANAKKNSNGTPSGEPVT